MGRRWSFAIVAVMGIVGCTTDSPSPITAPKTSAAIAAAEAVPILGSYVSVGTSISMGVQSDGVLAPAQQTSWPAQLAAFGNQNMSLPLIAAPGCRPPLASPLASFVRISGESVAIPSGQLSCAPNVAGVVLPARNVAINGALTSDALLSTPQTVTDPGAIKQYPRVLAPGMSQVTAMVAQAPRLVSIELGANEILGAFRGLYAPGVTVIPVANWAPVYSAVLNAVQSIGAKAVLVGLITKASSLPGVRRGGEIWTARATFTQFHVAIAPDCFENQSLIFVTTRVPAAVAAGAARAKQGLGPEIFSCADVPGTQDFVMTPQDIVLVEAHLAGINAVIRQEAAARGFAMFDLAALYEKVNKKAPFSAATLMLAPEPFGPYFSLDGVHPSALGQTVLAKAAASALNARYRLFIPVP
jgi:lysophospholipase L1-like esterase